MSYEAKVLTVSDSVMRGERQDESGPAVALALQEAGFEVVEQSRVPDGAASVAGDLTRMASGFTGLLVTTGGTGFGPRDLTPEGTAEVLDSGKRCAARVRSRLCHAASPGCGVTPW
jgi:molybdopterin adenylyltransferase